MRKNRVIVYSWPGWMFCLRTQEFLAENGIEFENRDIAKDPEALEDLKKPRYAATPVTIIDDAVFVGFDPGKLKQLPGIASASNLRP